MPVIYFLIFLFFVLIAYLGWQASIKPPSYEVMFEVLPIKGGCPPPESEGIPHLQDLEGAINFRDLGGYQTADGGCLAYGRLFRAGALNRLTEKDLALIQAAGIRIVCDLRSYAEARAQPDRLPASVDYRHLPVYIRDPIGGWRAVFQRHRLDQLFKKLYTHSIIDRGAPVLGSLMKLVADPFNLPLVFHCTRGKDRTGVIAALILHICGVPRETIVADYTLTNNSTDQFVESVRKSFRSIPAPPGFKLEQFYPLLSARPELIERAFAYIEASYGAVEAYLLGPVGMTEAELTAIRNNLLV